MPLGLSEFHWRIRLLGSHLPSLLARCYTADKSSCKEPHNCLSKPLLRKYIKKCQWVFQLELTLKLTSVESNMFVHCFPIVVSSQINSAHNCCTSRIQIRIHKQLSVWIVCYGETNFTIDTVWVLFFSAFLHVSVIDNSIDLQAKVSMPMPMPIQIQEIPVNTDTGLILSNVTRSTGQIWYQSDT